MRVLLTNDDGYDAPGLQALVRAFEARVEVVVVAPERQQSAQSHAFTLHKPLRVTERAPGRLSLSGTPADCAYAGIHGLVDPPDFVISGINHGPNLGTDVHYSGTVAAARESVLQGVPSIAASLVAGRRSELHWERAAAWVLRIAEATWDRGLPTGTFLNVNVPNKVEPRGIQVTGLGTRRYAKSVESRLDPRGNRYVWLGGGPVDDGAGPPDGDVRYASEGFVTVTPLHTDPTSPPELLDGWF